MLHDWYNKDRGMCYLICEMVHICGGYSFSDEGEGGVQDKKGHHNIMKKINLEKS